MTPSDGARFAVGDVIDQRYEVLGELDRGGMAVVLDTRNVITGRAVALKIIQAEHARKAELGARFLREARILGRLEHPAIVKLIDAAVMPDGTHYIAMERLRGQSLEGRIRERGAMPLDEIVVVVRALAAGLDFAHQKGVLHRDLKPANTFLPLAPAPGGEAKLLDFGIAKPSWDARLTKTGDVLGTPRYMPPEHVRGNLKADVRSDVYSLGVVVWEAATGKRFLDTATQAEMIAAIVRGTTPRVDAINPDVPPRVAKVIARAMAVDLAQRYGSAGEFAAALAAAVAGDERASERPASRSKASSVTSRSSLVLLAAVGVAAFLVATCALFGLVAAFLLHAAERGPAPLPLPPRQAPLPVE